MIAGVDDGSQGADPAAEETPQRDSEGEHHQSQNHRRDKSPAGDHHRQRHQGTGPEKKIGGQPGFIGKARLKEKQDKKAQKEQLGYPAESYHHGPIHSITERFRSARSALQCRGTAIKRRG